MPLPLLCTLCSRRHSAIGATPMIRLAGLPGGHREWRATLRYAQGMSTWGVAVTADGRRIHVDLDDFRGRRLVESDGELNPQSSKMWRRILAEREWDQVLDIGANYGEMIVGVQLPDGASVRAFEPNSVVRTLLEQTIADAGLEVEVLSCAVGREPGMLDFAIDTEWSGTSTLLDAETRRDSRWRHEIVDVTTVDELVGSEGSVCIKVDTEGFENDVLAGAAGLLASERPWAVLLEILHMPLDDVSRLAASYPMYALDQRTGLLVRIVGGNRTSVRNLLSSGWLYPQDAIITHAPLETVGEAQT